MTHKNTLNCFFPRLSMPAKAEIKRNQASSIEGYNTQCFRLVIEILIGLDQEFCDISSDFSTFYYVCENSVQLHVCFTYYRSNSIVIFWLCWQMLGWIFDVGMKLHFRLCCGCADDYQWSKLSELSAFH